MEMSDAAHVVIRIYLPVPDKTNSLQKLQF